MNTFFVLLLLGIGFLLRNGFDQYFMFTNPMTANYITVLDYYTYQLAFIINDYPFSIVVGMLQTLISIVLLFVANYASKKIRGDSIF